MAREPGQANFPRLWADAVDYLALFLATNFRPVLHQLVLAGAAKYDKEFSSSHDHRCSLRKGGIFGGYQAQVRNLHDEQRALNEFRKPASRQSFVSESHKKRFLSKYMYGLRSFLNGSPCSYDNTVSCLHAIDSLYLMVDGVTFRKKTLMIMGYSIAHDIAFWAIPQVKKKSSAIFPLLLSLSYLLPSRPFSWRFILPLPPLRSIWP